MLGIMATNQKTNSKIISRYVSKNLKQVIKHPVGIWTKAETSMHYHVSVKQQDGSLPVVKTWYNLPQCEFCDDVMSLLSNLSRIERYSSLNLG